MAIISVEASSNGASQRQKQNVNPPSRSERLRRLRDSDFLQATDRRVSLLKKSNKRRESSSLDRTVHVRARQPVQTRRSNGGVVREAVASRNGGSEIAEAGKQDLSQLLWCHKRSSDAGRFI